MKGNYILLFLVFWPIIGAFISYIIGKRNKILRNYFAIFISLVEFLAILALYSSFESGMEFKWDVFTGIGLYLKLDGFRFIYGLIASFMWLCTTIFSHEYFKAYRNRNRYYLFMLITLGGTMGVFLSADLLTTFILFEIMSFASYVMVIHDEKAFSMDAAETYMAVTVIGGLSLLIGMFLIKHHLGTTVFDELGPAWKAFEGDKFQIYLAGIFMMIGFGGKAGMFPLHIWLPNAHPVAPAPASALLSGILTKTGIFGAAVISSNIFLYDSSWGMGILIVGVITMFLGAFLGVFSVDLKRTLAYSSVSQIGFITVGLGMMGILGDHNALALRGIMLHMVNHSLIKLVLFMAAGVIYMNLHELNLNKIRGFGRKKPLFMFIFLMGALSIMGVPLWSGYVSKTLLHESILEHIWAFESPSSLLTLFKTIEIIFTITGGLTAAYMTKIFVAIFIEKNQDENHHSSSKGYMSKMTATVLLIPAILLLVLGLIPQLMDLIGKIGQGFFHGHDPAHEVHYFAWINLKGALYSLSIGAFVYLFIVRKFLMKKDKEGNRVYINPWPEKLDIEKYIYRPLLIRILPSIGEIFAKAIGGIVDFIGHLVHGIFKYSEGYYHNKSKQKKKSISTEGLNKIMPNTMRSGLFQFTAGLLIILIIVIFS